MNQVRRSNYGREYVDGNTVRKLNPIEIEEYMLTEKEYRKMKDR